MSKTLEFACKIKKKDEIRNNLFNNQAKEKKKPCITLIYKILRIDQWIFYKVFLILKQKMKWKVLYYVVEVPFMSSLPINRKYLLS